MIFFIHWLPCIIICRVDFKYRYFPFQIPVEIVAGGPSLVIQVKLLFVMFSIILIFMHKFFSSSS